MKTQYMLSVLYDLSLVLSNEKDNQLLAKSFLQRLLYHTGYSLAIYFNKDGNTWVMQQAVGNQALTKKIGNMTFCEADADLQHALKSTLGPLLSCYPAKQVLCVSESEQIILLAREITADQVKYPYGDLFAPVLQNFSKSYRLCSELKRSEQHLQLQLQERQQLVNELIVAKEQAEQLNQLKSDFLFSMSHELRTPMNSILGFAQILDYDDTLNLEQRDNVDEIICAGNHLLTLINEVLDLAKIESGQFELILEPVCLVNLINECIALTQVISEQCKISLDFEFTGTVYVLADKARLKQVLLNLLTNAIKYGQEGGRVWLEIKHIGNQSVRIIVFDNGIGMSIDQQKGLFQPFNRLGAEHSNIEGTGIGLTIAKRLIEMMNGKIDFYSEVNVGSQFWIDIPLTRHNDQSNEIINNNLRIDYPNAVEEKLQTVLYIDDNLPNLKLISQIFTKYNIGNLLTANDPKLGIELAVNNIPDLILLDINMPQLNGYQVLTIIQAQLGAKSPPIIAVSANAMHKDIQEAKAAGFAEYITKPIDIKSFLISINAYLSHDNLEEVKD